VKELSFFNRRQPVPQMEPILLATYSILNPQIVCRMPCGSMLQICGSSLSLKSPYVGGAVKLFAGCLPKNDIGKLPPSLSTKLRSKKTHATLQLEVCHHEMAGAATSGAGYPSTIMMILLSHILPISIPAINFELVCYFASAPGPSSDRPSPFFQPFYNFYEYVTTWYTYRVS
jgi:hypothetical protein